jgi:hypothetical protein
MDDLDQFWASVRERKAKQNARAIKAGKKPKHPELLKPKKSKAAVPPPAESGLEEDTALSFDEWKAQGWAVKKGSKATRFGMDGSPEFTRSQVRKNNPSWDNYRKRK